MLMAVKLFTYEFFLPDDPTSGIALRREPALINRGRLSTSPSGRTDRVFIQDENEFLGSGAYRFAVGTGWILFPALSIVTLLFSFVRRPEAESSKK